LNIRILYGKANSRLDENLLETPNFSTVGCGAKICVGMIATGTFLTAIK
jgi:hypothetical protein